MPYAIKFCREHNEHELWQQLVTHATRRADLVVELLRTATPHVDPSLIIKCTMIEHINFRTFSVADAFHPVWRFLACEISLLTC